MSQAITNTAANTSAPKWTESRRRDAYELGLPRATASAALNRARRVLSGAHATTARALLRLALGFVALGLAEPAGAGEPSFDFEQATSATERVICANDRLARLDRRMSRVFAGALDYLDRPDKALRQAQRQWLSERDRCGHDVACIANRYEQRIAALRDALAEVEDRPRYEVVEGEGYSVCEAMGEALAGRTPEDPMVCGLDGIEAHGFSHPDWRALDIEKHLGLFRRLDQTLRGDDSSPANDGKAVSALSADEWRRDFQWRKAQDDIGEPELLMGRLGLDGQGADETVLAVGWNEARWCEKTVSSASLTSFTFGRYAIYVVAWNGSASVPTASLDSTDGQLIEDGEEYLVADFQNRDFLMRTYYSTGANEAALWLYKYEEFGTGPRHGKVPRCRFKMPLKENQH